jgi:hypothetical protein
LLNNSLRAVKPQKENTMQNFTSRRQKAIQALKGHDRGLKTFKTFGIISADNPMGVQASLEENKKNREKMEQILKRDLLNYFKATGHYNQNERSYVIFNCSLEDMISLAKIFNQESFIFATVVDTDDTQFKVNFEYWNVADDGSGEYEKLDEVRGYDMITEDESKDDSVSYYTLFGKNFKFNIPFPIFVANEVVENEEKFSNPNFARNFDYWTEGATQDKYTWKHKVLCRAKLKRG